MLVEYWSAHMILQFRNRSARKECRKVQSKGGCMRLWRSRIDCCRIERSYKNIGLKDIGIAQVAVGRRELKFVLHWSVLPAVDSKWNPSQQMKLIGPCWICHFGSFLLGFGHRKYYLCCCYHLSCSHRDLHYWSALPAILLGVPVQPKAVFLMLIALIYLLFPLSCFDAATYLRFS